MNACTVPADDVPTGDLPPAAQLAARLASAPDARLAAVALALVQAFSDLSRHHDLSREDLRALIGFLTEVGEACSDQRQEWVLLADALGLSSTLERQLSRRPDAATPDTLAGPFYRPGAPRRKSGEAICLDNRGEPLLFVAHVHDLDGTPVSGARIEVWQANGDGLYENQAPDLQPEFNLRGCYQTGSDGTVLIRTIRPRGYALPGDGPVSALLARLGLGRTRPAHLQFRITATGFQTLTTHVFDRDDPAIGSDPLFAVRPALLADFVPDSAEGLKATYTFVLAPVGTAQKPTTDFIGG
ncbi:dioxygenase family protein [Pararhodobacter sp.]|uniref:dioxygenase family protein n=1 Tax=Pararhodobacter sp. TaxID=2127056 RepID=UPI002FDD4434